MQRRVTVLALLLILSGSLTPNALAAGSPLAEAESIAGHARVLFDAGRFPEAIDAYTRAIALVPKSEYYRLRGTALVEMGQIHPGLADLDRAIELNPRSASAWNMRGLVRLEQYRDLAGAFADFSKAIEADSTDYRAWHNRATLQTRQRNYDGARHDYEQAVRADPSYADSHLGLGILELEAGRPEIAVEHLSRALQLKPDHADAHYERAQAHRDLGNLPEAWQDAERAPTLKPDYGQARQLLASLPPPSPVASPVTPPFPPGPISAPGLLAVPPAAPVPQVPPPGVMAPPVVAPVPQVSPPLAQRTVPAPPSGSGAPPIVPGERATPEAAPRRAPSPPPTAQPPAPASRPLAVRAAETRTSVAPLALRLPLDIRTLTLNHYHAVVIAAREAMRLVYGKMTPEQTRQFETKWTPPLAYPTAEAVDYFNKLNPLLAEFLSLRETIYHASQEFEAAWAEAMIAAAHDLPEAAQEALAIAEQQKAILQGLNLQLAQVAQAIEALGDPPDPTARRGRARKRHDEALGTMRQLVPAKADKPQEEPEGIGVFTELRKKNIPADAVYTKSTQFVQNKVDTTYGNTSLRSAKETIDKSGEFRDLGKRDEKKGTPIPEWDATPVRTLWNVAVSWTEPSKTMKSKDTITFGCTGTHSVVTSRADKKPATPAYSINVGGHLGCSCDQKTSTCQKSAQFWQVAGGVGSERFIRVSAMIGTLGPPDRFPGWGAIEYQYVYRLAKDAGEAATLAKQRDQQPPSEEGRFEASPQEATQAAIEFHRINIQLIERNLAREQEELARETDPARRDALEFRIRNLRSDIQPEQDLIASIQTGQYVHTRTEADDYIHRQFVANIYADQERMHQAQHQVAELQRLAGALPPGEAEQARDFINRQITAGDVVRNQLGNGRRPPATIDTSSPEVKRLTWAAMPLIMRMREDQKKEVRTLARVIGLEAVASQI